MAAIRSLSALLENLQNGPNRLPRILYSKGPVGEGSPMSGLGEIRGRKSDRAVTADPAEATKPLADVRILDLTRLLPGGYCTLLLADMGADVVKVEEPGRRDYIRWIPPMVDGESASHRALNRGKRSTTLNLKSPEGVEILKRLATT